MAPELSLSTNGTRIPMVEVPECPYPTVRDMASMLTMVGQMIMGRPVPTHTIKALGDETSKTPNIYKKGDYTPASYVKLNWEFPDHPRRELHSRRRAGNKGAR